MQPQALAENLHSQGKRLHFFEGPASGRRVMSRAG